VDAFVVRGRSPLTGTVRVGGAKNSALKLAAATLLTEGRSRLRNVPDIADMRVMADVLGYLGVRVQREDNSYTFEVPEEVGLETPAHLVRQLRASIVVLGPLLARGGRARVAMPGGCDLGNRNIDMHLSGLARLGAEVTFGADFVEARAERLRGSNIDLAYPSVGATENLLMAAVLAEGETRISGAAREPEIGDLASYLRAMGADVQGDGTPELVIRGVDALAPADHRVVPDRIEAGTYAVAAAVAGGTVRIEGAVAAQLRLALDKLRAAGAGVSEDGGAIVVEAPVQLRAADVATLPFPGFPTDLQPMFLVLLSQASGTSLLTENVFDARFSVVGELARMGAEIEVEGHHAIVRGPRRLYGTTVRATDLRAGAALVVAGLCADGETVVTEPAHVERGYADLAGKLRALGADVERRRPEAPRRAEQRDVTASA
jgi:UDP-N-acetylglucosamine 1-carboxyvinyltransferase